jgi:hypothetical protein
MRHALTVVTLFAVLAASPAARAEIQKQGPEVWPGKNEFSVHMGWQNGINGYGNGFGGPPTGFKVFLDYSFRFTELMWLNFGANLVFAGSCGNNFNCFAGNGNTIEPEAGIKFKFVLNQIPLVPYAKADVVFVGIYNRPCNDNGFAIAGRASGGAKYFLTKNIGLGAETGFVAGPAFLNGTAACGVPNGAHGEFYFAWDIGLGAEFIF